MVEYRLSDHARVRMRQRGRRSEEVELLIGAATQVEPGAYLLTDADVRREVDRRKREIARLERLAGWKFIVAGDTIVSCYHSRREDQKRILRRGRAGSSMVGGRPG